MKSGAVQLTTRGEDGLQKLIEAGQLPETHHFADQALSWADVLTAVQGLTDQQHSFKTFVLDTANGAERLAHETACLDQFADDWGEGGFNAFGRGEKISANKHWLPFLAALDRLRQERRLRIVLTAHTIIRTFTPPDGPPYDRIEPALSKLAWSATSKWADMILYGSWDVTTQPVRRERGRVTKAPATGGKLRLLHTAPSPTFDAGNRHGLAPLIKLPDDPQAAFPAFLAAFPKPRPRPPAQPATTNGELQPSP